MSSSTRMALRLGYLFMGLGMHTVYYPYYHIHICTDEFACPNSKESTSAQIMNFTRYLPLPLNTHNPTKTISNHTPPQEPRQPHRLQTLSHRLQPHDRLPRRRPRKLPHILRRHRLQPRPIRLSRRVLPSRRHGLGRSRPSFLQQRCYG